MRILRGATQLLPALVLICALYGCGFAEEKARRTAEEEARARLDRVADELDQRTTPTGSYIRVGEDEISDKDIWGTQVKVKYSQDGVSEDLTVRSAGPDQEFYTRDDVTVKRVAVNLKGVGRAVKENTEDVAADAAKGIVKGTSRGIKESVKDAISRRVKNGAAAEPSSTEEEATKDEPTRTE